MCKRHDWSGYEVFIYFANVRLLRAIIKLFGEKRGVFISDDTPKQSYYNVRAGLDRAESKQNQSIMKAAVLGHKSGDNPDIPTVIFDYCGIPVGQGYRSDIETIFKNIKEGKFLTMDEVAEQYPTEFCKYGSKIEKYFSMIRPKRNWKTNVICYWGKGGTGKSFEVWAQEGMENVETITLSGQRSNPFVLNYTGTKEAVLIDDFNFTAIDPTWFLNITDRYPQVVNVKGGEMNWNPKTLYICANIHPREWWGDWSPQIKRRFNEIIEVRCENTLADMEPKESVMFKKTPNEKRTIGKPKPAKKVSTPQPERVKSLLSEIEEQPDAED